MTLNNTRNMFRKSSGDSKNMAYMHKPENVNGIVTQWNF